MLSLFNSDTGTPYTQEADFFSMISTLCGIITDNVQATHQHHAHDCPIAATFGYRGSNAASESLMVNPFGIYHLMGRIAWCWEHWFLETLDMSFPYACLCYQTIQGYMVCRAEWSQARQWLGTSILMIWALWVQSSKVLYWIWYGTTISPETSRET